MKDKQTNMFYNSTITGCVSTEPRSTPKTCKQSTSAKKKEYENYHNL